MSIVDKYKAGIPYKIIGCWKDEHPDRAMQDLEGGSTILDGLYKLRSNAIEKCYQLVKKLGFSVFALQDGGQCFGSDKTKKTFNKYGLSLDCLGDGKGGPMANQVYAIKGNTLDTRL